HGCGRQLGPCLRAGRARPCSYRSDPSETDPAESRADGYLCDDRHEWRRPADRLAMLAGTAKDAGAGIARQYTAGDTPVDPARDLVFRLAVVRADRYRAFADRHRLSGPWPPCGVRGRAGNRIGDRAMIWSVAFSLLGLMALTIPVGIVLFLLGIGVGEFYSAFPLLRGLGQVVWSSSASSTLIAIPLFVLLGELLVRGGVAERTYAALDKWLSWLPGGLVHANIATATMFSATSGSSVATAATVATVAMPQAERLNYDPRLFSGAIAAGGTLGILIPPSINLIVYGFLTETSIPKLFSAGLVPGLLLAAAFIIVTAAICMMRPSLGGPS